MQDVPLTVDRILDHAAAWHGPREVVSRDADGLATRSTYAAIHADAKRVSNALLRAGVRPVDRVSIVVPMYHANAWGVVCSAPAVGAKLVCRASAWTVPRCTR